MIKIILKVFFGIVAAIALLITSYLFYFSGSSHVPTNVLATMPFISPGGPILVFGGNRGTGLEVVKKLHAHGENLTVAVRANSRTTELEKLGIKTVIADVLDAAAVRQAFTSEPFVAVISTLGSARTDKMRRPDYIGNRNVIEAAKAAGAQRFILITTIGSGDSLTAAPWASRKFLHEVIVLRTQAEEHLVRSGLDYTIIRPGGLGNVKATGTSYLTADTAAFSYISRIDLAALIVQALGDKNTIGQIYSTYDSSRPVMWNMLKD